MSNSEEKAKSYQSRFCSQALITRLQFGPCTENKQKTTIINNNKPYLK